MAAGESRRCCGGDERDEHAETYDARSGERMDHDAPLNGAEFVRLPHHDPAMVIAWALPGQVGLCPSYLERDRQLATSDLHDSPGDPNVSRCVDAQAQPAGATRGFALAYRPVDRERAARGEVPAPEVGARGSRPWVFDESASLEEEEPRRERAVGPRSPHVHVAVAPFVRPVPREENRVRPARVDCLDGRERDDELLGPRVDPQGGPANGLRRDSEHGGQLLRSRGLSPSGWV